jgi:hypothetical protein
MPRFVEVLVEMGVGHEMPAKKLHRFHLSPHRKCSEPGKISSDYSCNRELYATAMGDADASQFDLVAEN